MASRSARACRRCSTSFRCCWFSIFCRSICRWRSSIAFMLETSVDLIRRSSLSKSSAIRKNRSPECHWLSNLLLHRLIQIVMIWRLIWDYRCRNEEGRSASVDKASKAVKKHEVNVNKALRITAYCGCIFRGILLPGYSRSTNANLTMRVRKKTYWRSVSCCRRPAISFCRSLVSCVKRSTVSSFSCWCFSLESI